MTALANEQEESRGARHDDAEEGEAQWWLQLMPVDGFLLLEPACCSLPQSLREGGDQSGVQGSRPQLWSPASPPNSGACNPLMPYIGPEAGASRLRHIMDANPSFPAAAFCNL